MFKKIIEAQKEHLIKKVEEWYSVNRRIRAAYDTKDLSSKVYVYCKEHYSEREQFKKLITESKAAYYYCLSIEIDDSMISIMKPEYCFDFINHHSYNKKMYNKIFNISRILYIIHDKHHQMAPEDCLFTKEQIDGFFYVGDRFSIYHEPTHLLWYLKNIDNNKYLIDKYYHSVNVIDCANKIRTVYETSKFFLSYCLTIEDDPNYHQYLNSSDKYAYVYFNDKLSNQDRKEFMERHRFRDNIKYRVDDYHYKFIDTGDLSIVGDEYLDLYKRNFKINDVLDQKFELTVLSSERLDNDYK